MKRAFAGVIRPAEQNAKASMPQANLRRPYFPPQQAAKAPCPLFAGSRCKTGRACFTASIAHLPAAVHAEQERRRKKITCAEKCKGPAPALTLPRRPWYGNDRVFLNDTDVPYLSLIHILWFDGACGEGPNGRRQEYDFDGYIQLIRQYQPNATIFNDRGPDVRWIGNEAGEPRAAEWAVVLSLIHIFS